MIHGVFFDLDGTLFDTVNDINNAYGSVFQSMNIAFDPAKLRIGPPLTECLRQFKPDITPEETAEAVAAFRKFYDGCDFSGTHAYNGIPEMLDTLHKLGINLFVATNKRIDPTLKILEVKGITKYFTAIYGCDSDPVNKRTKADYLQIAMEKYDLAPENCLMVGDTRLDVEAGHKAGIRAVGVTWGYDADGELAASKPEWIISRAGELVTLVKDL